MYVYFSVNSSQNLLKVTTRRLKPHAICYVLRKPPQRNGLSTQTKPAVAAGYKLISPPPWTLPV